MPFEASHMLLTPAIERRTPANWTSCFIVLGSSDYAIEQPPEAETVGVSDVS